MRRAAPRLLPGPRWFAGVVGSITAVGALAVGVAIKADNNQPETLGPGMGRIVEIIDGDTVVIAVAGHHESTRLLGIDTPETNHPTRPVECYGAEATERLRQLAPPGTVVRLERDEEARDHYGRLLAYLFLPGPDEGVPEIHINLQLVAEGFAVTLPIDPNRAHRRAFADAERTARASRTGLWGTCGGPGVAVEPHPRG